METSIAPAEVSTDLKVSTLDSLKSILASLTAESVTIKNLIVNVKTVLKDVERQSKDYDKLLNKRSRNKGEKRASDVPSGITKPVAISDELAVFLGVSPGTLVPRNEVTKGVSAYVKKYELSDPTNRQKFSFSNSPEGKVLFKLLGEPAEEVTYFNLQRYLKSHYIQGVPAVTSETKPVEPVKAAAPVKAAEPVVAAPVVAEDASSQKVKKKILVKKSKSSGSQLVEDSA